jgi:hypothetical protein
VGQVSSNLRGPSIKQLLIWLKLG